MNTFSVKCPHPDCHATLNVRPEFASGEYECLCKQCRVKVTWITHVTDGRKPYVRLVDEEKDGDA